MRGTCIAWTGPSPLDPERTLHDHVMDLHRRYNLRDISTLIGVRYNTLCKHVQRRKPSPALLDAIDAQERLVREVEARMLALASTPVVRWPAQKGHITTGLYSMMGVPSVSWIAYSIECDGRVAYCICTDEKLPCPIQHRTPEGFIQHVLWDARHCLSNLRRLT